MKHTASSRFKTYLSAYGALPWTRQRRGPLEPMDGFQGPTPLVGVEGAKPLALPAPSTGLDIRRSVSYRTSSRRGEIQRRGQER